MHDNSILLRLSLMLCCANLLVGCASHTEHTSMPAFLPEGIVAPKEDTPPISWPAHATLEACVETALTARPELRVHHALWRSKLAASRAVIRWQDPVLMYTFAPLPIETRLGAQRHIISLEQAVPWPGRVEAAASARAARADAAASSFDAAYLQVRLNVTRIYWELWHVEQTIEVLTTQRALLESIELGLRAQVEIGRRPASELARLGVARVTLDEHVRMLHVEAHTWRTRLGAAMGSDGASQQDAPSLTTSPLLDTSIQEIDEVLSVTQKPPHLQALSHITRGEREALELARLQNRPGLKLGAQWSGISAHDDMTAPEAGQDAVMFKVGVTLPVWQDAAHAEVDAAEAAIVASLAQESVAQLEWVTQLRITHALILDGRRRIEVIEDTLMPMTRSAFEMSRGDYEVERVELTAMLQSVEDLLELELSRLAQHKRLAQHLATWEWLTGQPLQEPRP